MSAGQPASPVPLPWRVCAVAVVLLAGAALWLEGPHPINSGASWSIHGSLASVWLLAVAAVLYLVAYLADAPAARLWASRLALWGAAGVLAASAVRGLQAMWWESTASFVQTFELPSWLASLAVLATLHAQPRAVRHDGEVLIVLLALVALWLDLWLMAWTAQLPAGLATAIRLHGQWLWHVAGKFGVLACAFLGLWCLAGFWPRLRARLRHEAKLRAALCGGLAGFTLALLVALATLVLPGDHAAAAARALAGAAVWLNFMALVLVWRHWRSSDEQFALGIALSLGLAVLGYVGAGSMEDLL